MVEEVIRLLEEEQQSFVPARVALAVQKYGLEVEDLDGLSKEVLAEGVRRTMPAVEKFFDALKIPAPLEKVEEVLWKGGGIWVHFPNPRVGRKDFTVSIHDPTNHPPNPTQELTFPPSWWHEPLYGSISLHAFPGEVSLRDHSQGMYWGRGKAILQVRGEEAVERVRKAAKTLEPFLSHIGLDGIIEALDALSMLREGEAQVKGPYVLARTDPLDWRYKGEWLMRRGTILGDLQVRGEEAVERVRKAAKTLEPFLSHIGLDGIIEALDALSMLREGEAQVKGPYVLARTDPLDWRYKGEWLMRRGTILGDPELDKAALLGRKVTLSFPGDVEISFRAVWVLYTVSLADVQFRLGHKVLNLDEDSLEGFSALSLYSDPIGRAIQRGLKRQFERLDDRILVKEYRNLEEVFLDEVFQGKASPVFSSETPPGMLTFLRTLAEHDNPFRALAEGRLTPHIKADLSPEF